MDITEGPDQAILLGRGVGAVSNVTGYGTIDLLDKTGNLKSLRQLENEIIRFGIGHYRGPAMGSIGHISETARRLKIGRSTLYRKLDKYGINTNEAAPV